MWPLRQIRKFDRSEAFYPIGPLKIFYSKSRGGLISAVQVLHDGAVALVSVGGAKYGAAGHERVGACRHNGSDIASLDAAVHLEPDRLAARGLVGIDAATGLAQLGQGAGNETLAAKSGVDRHQQDDIKLVHYVIHPFQRRGRIEHNTGLAAMVADQLQRAVHMAAGFGMERDDVGAGLGKHGHQAVHRLHHQMHINRYLHMRPDGFAHQRADSEIGDVVVVHHVEMHQIGASGFNGPHFFTQTGKVGRQDGRGKADG